MPEYIDRDAVYDAILVDGGLNAYGKAYCIDIVRKIPPDAVDMVRHGRWALNEDCQPFYNYCTADYYYNCSECNYTISSRYGLYNYCPNCGAKMDGGDEDG